MRPDHTVVTIQREGEYVTARASGPSPQDRATGSSTDPSVAVDAGLEQLGVANPQENTADSILHRAGFVPVVVSYRDRFHRLPAAMTDPDEQRRAVTRAVDMLRADGFVYACEADLLDPSLPVHRDHPTPLGDQIARLTQAIAQAGHTNGAVAALSELTAPGNGVLDRVIENLEETADWWEGLGAPVDPLHADKLRRITSNLEISTMEIQAMRSDLADRHTAHPIRGHDETPPPEPEEVRSRIRAAMTPSPHRTPPSPSPTASTTAPPVASAPTARPRR